MQLRKHIIILVCLLAITAGLSAAIIVLGRARPQVPVPSALENGATVLVYELENPVEALAVTHSNGAAYTLAGLSYDSGRATDATLLDYDRQHVDSSRVRGVLNASRSLYAIELLFDNPKDYAPFGLDDPRAVVEITSDGGQSVITLLIGDTSAGNEGIYLKRAESSEIYLVPIYSLENFLLSEAAYLNRAVTSGGQSGLYKVILGGTAREETGRVVIEKHPDGYLVTAPFLRPLDEINGLAILSSLLNISADSVAAVNPSREELVSLGLNKPYSTAEVSGPETEVFYLSATVPDAGGTVYLYREDVPLIYAVQADMLPWLDVQYIDIIDPFAYTADIGSLSQVEVAAGDDVYVFDLAHDGGELTVSVGERKLDAEDFRGFYVTLISARITGHAHDSPGDEKPVLSFTYRHATGERHAVRFFRGPPRRYYLQTDSGDCFITSAVYVDGVLEELDRMVAAD